MPTVHQGECNGAHEHGALPVAAAAISWTQAQFQGCVSRRWKIRRFALQCVPSVTSYTLLQEAAKGTVQRHAREMAFLSSRGPIGSRPAIPSEHARQTSDPSTHAHSRTHHILAPTIPTVRIGCMQRHLDSDLLAALWQRAVAP